jgi:hypothetical protein
MSILDSMLSGAGGALINQLTGRLGINAEQATSAVSALVPTIATGMNEKIANNDTGLANLLTGEKMTQFAGDLSNLGTPAAEEAGNNLVSRIFTSAETSKIVATVAERVGIGADTVTKMLPIVATFEKSGDIAGFLYETGPSTRGRGVPGFFTAR